MSRRRSSSIDPLFDEQPENNWGRYALIAAIVVIVGFVLFATLGGTREPQGPVPLIRADETPWTRAPSETGGMEIPNQDSTVFELMDKTGEGGEATATTETAPVDETADKTAETSEDKPVDEAVKEAADKAVEDTASKTAEKPVEDKKTLDQLVDESMTPEEKTEAKAPVIGEEKKAVTTRPEDEPAPIPQKAKPVETAKPAPVAEPEPEPKADMVKVRLGAMPGSDNAPAAKEFARLKGLSGGKLSAYSPSYEAVNLPKGSFVRINVSMDRASAASLCDTLSSKGAPCLILAP